MRSSRLLFRGLWLGLVYGYTIAEPLHNSQNIPRRVAEIAAYGESLLISNSSHNDVSYISNTKSTSHANISLPPKEWQPGGGARKYLFEYSDHLSGESMKAVLTEAYNFVTAKIRQEGDQTIPWGRQPWASPHVAGANFELQEIFVPGHPPRLSWKEIQRIALNLVYWIDTQDVNSMVNFQLLDAAKNFVVQGLINKAQRSESISRRGDKRLSPNKRLLSSAGPFPPRRWRPPRSNTQYEFDFMEPLDKQPVMDSLSGALKEVTILLRQKGDVPVLESQDAFVFRPGNGYEFWTKDLHHFHFSWGQFYRVLDDLNTWMNEENPWFKFIFYVVDDHKGETIWGGVRPEYNPTLPQAAAFNVSSKQNSSSATTIIRRSAPGYSNASTTTRVDYPPPMKWRSYKSGLQYEFNFGKRLDRDKLIAGMSEAVESAHVLEARYGDTVIPQTDLPIYIEDDSSRFGWTVTKNMT